MVYYRDQGSKVVLSSEIELKGAGGSGREVA
jgi:hypothetical protein